MRFDKFTTKSQEAVQAAQRLAEDGRNPQIAPEHLLLVLLEQDGGLVPPILRKLGVPAERLRRELNAAREALPTLSSDSSEPVGASDELVAVLRAAEHEMRELGDEYVSAEHLLLSLAGHNSKAAEALRANGATKERLLQALEQVRGSHRVTDQSPEDRYQALERFGVDLTAQAEEG